MNHPFLSNWSCQQCWTSDAALQSAGYRLNMIQSRCKSASCHNNADNDTIDELLEKIEC